MRPRHHLLQTKSTFVAISATIVIIGTITTLLLVTVTEGASQYDVCARGIADTFTRTAHVQISVEGPPLAQETNDVLASLVNRLVWQGHAEQVFIETYDEALCSASLGQVHQITVTLTQAELDEIKNALTRSQRGEVSTFPAFGSRAIVQIPPLLEQPQAAHPYYTLRVYFATNRHDSGQSSVNERFESRRGKGLSFGAVHVTIPKEHRMGELETPSILKLEFRDDPQKHIALQSIHRLDPETWRKELQIHATRFDQPGVLLFIHGYNVGFVGAALRTAQLTYDLNFRGPSIFFSWPSHAGLLPYSADEQEAEWATPDMEQVLADISGLAPGIPVYLIAHSMGNRILTRAFGKLLREDPSKRRSFKEIVLTAPDIDADVFRREIAPEILGKGPHVTLYASSRDVALVASRQLHGGNRRLGESMPEVTILAGMETIDASSVKTDFLGHSYFGDSRTVMSDLFYLIRKRLKPNMRFALERVHSANGAYWRFKR